MTLANPVSGFIAMPVGVVVVGLTLAWLLLLLRKHELAFWDALRRLSPSSRSSRWQIALALVLAVGIGLNVLMPEANVVFAAVDAAGLDLMTILIALEPRHYIVIAHQFA